MTKEKLSDDLRHLPVSITLPHDLWIEVKSLESGFRSEFISNILRTELEKLKRG